MALSELDMMNLWAKQLRGYKSQWERLFDFGYAVEAEVRKQDDALILQLVEALEAGLKEVIATCENEGVLFGPDQHVDAKLQEAITAARARLAPPQPTA